MDNPKIATAIKLNRICRAHLEALHERGLHLLPAAANKSSDPSNQAGDLRIAGSQTGTSDTERLGFSGSRLTGAVIKDEFNRIVASHSRPLRALLGEEARTAGTRLEARQKRGTLAYQSGRPCHSTDAALEAATTKINLSYFFSASPSNILGAHRGTFRLEPAYQGNNWREP